MESTTTRYSAGHPPKQATAEQLQRWRAIQETAEDSRKAAALTWPCGRSTGGRTPHARLSDLPAPADGFMAAVADYQAAEKCSLNVAMRQVARTVPAAHRAFIMARNGGRLPEAYQENQPTLKGAKF